MRPVLTRLLYGRMNPALQRLDAALAMDVAVVITLFNGARWITETLESVLGQSQRPAEVVVVDDGSTDESPALVQAFPGVKLLNNPGKGHRHARNYGFLNTSAPLVAFLDQDDLWHREHLRLLGRILMPRPKVPAAVATTTFFTDRPVWKDLPRDLQLAKFDPWRFYPFNKVDTPSAVLMRRERLRELGGWPLAWEASDDYFVWLSLGLGSHLLFSLPATTAYRQRADSMSAHRRTRQAADYLRQRKIVLEAALQNRLLVHPDESSDLRRRLAGYDAVAGVLLGLVERRGDALQRFAVELESHLTDRPKWYRTSAFNHMRWFLDPVLSCTGSAQAEDIVDCFQAHWPADAHRTRRKIRAIFRWYGIG